MNRGLLPGGITIEGEHDAGTQLLPINLQWTNQLHRAQRIVGDKTTYDFGMFRTERGTACGNRGVDSGQMHGHHVGIAFDDHHLTFLDNRSLRHINAIQHLVFAVQRRIRRIDVFRADRIVLIQFACAKTKRTTGRIANRPCYAATKIVVHPMLSLASQSRVQHLLLREAFAGQVPNQIVPTLRSVSTTETLAIGLAEVTTIKQFTCGERVFGHQLRYEKLLRGLIGFQQASTF